jgi:membrane-associated phospholipid phosphatase
MFAAFLILTAFVIAGWTQSVDDAWLSLMEDLEVPWLLSVAELFHHLGSVPIALTTSLLVAVTFIVAKKWWAFWAWFAIVAGAQVFSTVTKLLVDRPRPVDALVHESSASYPSGHAMVAGAAIGIGLAVILGIIWPIRYRLFLGVGIAYAVVMAWSRTYLRVHWLTDVVGGLVFGTAIVCLVAVVVIQSRGDARDDVTEPGG